MGLQWWLEQHADVLIQSDRIVAQNFRILDVNKKKRSGNSNCHKQFSALRLCNALGNFSFLVATLVQQMIGQGCGCLGTITGQQYS